jgi:predicted dienelactone hydrolase
MTRMACAFGSSSASVDRAARQCCHEPALGRCHFLKERRRRICGRIPGIDQGSIEIFHHQPASWLESRYHPLQRLLARLGIFGHSFGGATAAQVCHMDTRCKAGINIDGDFAGDVVQAGLDKPFMVIQHDMGTCSDSACRSFQHDIQAVLRTVPRGASYHISIKDTKHFNFTDYAIHFSPLLHVLGLLGSIDGQRGLQITRAYVRAFFDTYLNNTPSPLLRDSASAYPEVQFYTP